MNRERDKAFNNWEAQATRETGEEIAWQSGYTAALEARPTDVSSHIQKGIEAGRSSNNAMPMAADELIHIARQNERDAIEKKLLAMAGAAFIAGRDDHAHWFRSLVNVLFKKPGDTSV